MFVLIFEPLIDMPTEELQTAASTHLIRIVLVDSHPIALLGLNTLLTSNHEFEIVASLNSEHQILETIKLTQPDIILMDFHLPKVDGVQLVHDVQMVGGDTSKIVIYTATLSKTETCDLIRAGVKGILLKEMPISLIRQCLRQVHAGGEWLERRAMRSAFEQILRRESELQEISTQLSPREINLATLIATGHNNKSAARELRISEGSARVYLNRIYSKLHISNRLQLALLFKDKGLV